MVADRDLKQRPPMSKPSKRGKAKSAPAERLPPLGGGLQCVRCGCRHFEVMDTERREKVIRRKRACRHCGMVAWTLEMDENAPPSKALAWFLRWFRFKEL